MEEHDTTMSDFDDEKSTQYNLRVATSDAKRHVFLYTQYQLAADVTGLKVLDVGCGDGQAYRALLAQGAAQATACDISASMIHACKNTDNDLGFQDRVQYVLTDATRGALLEGGPFDVILCNFVLNLIDNERTLRQMLHIFFINCTAQGTVLAISSIGAFPASRRDYIAQACGDIYPLLPKEGLPLFTPCPVTLFPGIHVTCYHTPIQFMLDLFGESGFTHVARKPWMKDPTYTGESDLDQFIAHDPAYLIEAKKRL